MDTAYAAGLFDGEGCIRIATQKRGNHLGYQLIVCVNMTDPRPLLALQRAYGGSFYPGTGRKNPNHRKLCCWTICARGALAFLELIRPWLIVKAQEADLAIEFQKGKQDKPAQAKISPAEMSRRERIKSRITRLKHVIYDPADFGMGANSVDTQNGQYRAKQPHESAAGACNEQVLPSTEKMCSGLHGNMQSEAEMTSPFPIISADWMPEGKWALWNPASWKE